MLRKKTDPRLKILAIVMSGIWMPLGYFVAVCLASGQLLKGFIALLFYEVLIIIDAYIFWKLLGK